MSQSTPDYLRPYEQAAAERGPGFEATLWNNRTSQRRRFGVFVESADFAQRTVLDAGCGPGDFAAYLAEHGVDYAAYIGIDGVSDVVNEAERRGLSRARFVHGDFVANRELLPEHLSDVVVLSGSLNTMDEGTALRVLDAAWRAAGEALLFNFLSDRPGPGATRQVRPARRLPTLDLVRWALDHTHDVVLRHDYFPHGHDATIRMRRPASPDAPSPE